MANLIDREAAFKERLSSLGIRADVKNGLRVAGFDTYGAYAYSFTQPGQKIEDSAFSEWVSSSISASCACCAKPTPRSARPGAAQPDRKVRGRAQQAPQHSDRGTSGACPQPVGVVLLSERVADLALHRAGQVSKPGS